MANAETQAIVQDSCERWWIIREYCKRWVPDFERRETIREHLSRELRSAVRDMNGGQGG